MATLSSPGVSVSIIDESFYSTAGQGTIPLIIMATSASKTNPSGDIAPYSLPTQAGKLFLATSQRELITNYGAPSFKTVNGTAIHGYELNEYGLNAAYSYLGISNRCYVLRADIDLAQLEASSTQPVSNPTAGTYWLDLSNTLFGVFQSNGNPNVGLAWQSKNSVGISEADTVTSDDTEVPSPSYGTDGQFAVVVSLSDNILYEKISGTWYHVGSPEWKAARPTTVTGIANPANVSTTDSIIINSTEVVFDAGTGTLSDVITAINDAAITHITASQSGTNGLKITDSSGADILLNNGSGTPLTTLGLTAGVTYGVKFFITNDAQYPSNMSAGSVWIKGTTPNKGANWVVKYWNTTTSAFDTLSVPFYPYNSSLNDGNVVKDQAATTAFGTPLTGTVYLGYDLSNGGVQQLRRWDGLKWTNLSYEAGTIAPTNPPAEGTFWYNTDYRVDIMYGTGQAWMGYRTKFPNTDPKGVILDASQPTLQSDGTDLVDNDLWIDTSDLENYPKIYRYQTSTSTWVLVDNTDQTTPFGIVFADARQNSGVNFTGNTNAGSYDYNSEATDDMLVSAYVDPDAPQPASYPMGTLLFNTRYSTYNVKEWKPNYFKAGGFSDTDYTNNTYTVGTGGALFAALGTAGRWVTASGNKTDGSPYMGRKAQRTMIVRSLASVVINNDDIRSELVYYNLLAAPGYPELIDELNALNVDQKEISFIVADTPIRLTPDGTSVTKWANNGNNVTSNGEDGLVTQDPYIGVYYPWGLSTDLSGNEIVVPPSQVALNTIAYNDQVSYPWFAPAGTRRGLVSNVTSVGYLGSDGEYKPVILNNGQRDVLYENKINPIAYVPGKGLVVYGQKTLNPNATSLDRINVARLVNYVRYNLDNLVVPFLFEQNDAETREAAKNLVTRFFNGLVGLRALEDYAVVCDETNNTADRRNRNELWVDVAIKPIKAIEFIYIPVRILSSDEDITA